MSLLDDFARVSKRRRCPVCGKPKWCLVSKDSDTDPSKVLCRRVETPCRWGEAGWLHNLKESSRPATVCRFRAIRLRTSDPRLAELASELVHGRHPDGLVAAASGLGVSLKSLLRLGAGWLDAAALRAFGLGGYGGALAFPMYDAHGVPIGVRLRRDDGRKFAIPGSRNGLSLPKDLAERSDLLLLAEGPTDTAALLDLGFDVAGRPSCNGALSLLEGLVARLRPVELVVVADNDRPGREGAAELARALRLYCVRVRVIAPPDSIKDVREWKRRGGTRDDVLRAIDAAPCLGLALTVCQRGGRS